MEVVMKTCFSAVTMIIVLTAFAWGQNAPASPDAKVLEKEMEIIRGILGSELTSYIQDLRDQYGDPYPGRTMLNVPVIADMNASPNLSISFWSSGGNSESLPPIDISALSNAIVNNLHSASIGNGFYLPEQGVVFMIPTSVLRNNVRIALPAPMSSVAAIDNLRERIRGLEASIHEPGARHEEMVAVRKEINELQKDMQALMSGMQYDEAAINNQTFRQALDGLKNLLVDTLAKYGDSLSAVKPGEHINLILQRPSWDASGPNVGIISARKSWITDYKAGKMTLEEFRKKVLHSFSM
jgi:hypothetical protein